MKIARLICRFCGFRPPPEPQNSKKLSRRTIKPGKRFDHEIVTRAVSRIMLGFPHIGSISGWSNRKFAHV